MKVAFMMLRRSALAAWVASITLAACALDPGASDAQATGGSAGSNVGDAGGSTGSGGNAGATPDGGSGGQDGSTGGALGGRGGAASTSGHDASDGSPSDGPDDANGSHEGSDAPGGGVLGQPCNGAAECASDACVDGVCCASGSCPACQACDLNGLGTCSNLPAGATATCPEDDANCTRGCDGLGNCQPAAAGTACGPGTCMNGPDSLGFAAHVGQYVSVSVVVDRCDGSAGERAACKPTTEGDCGGLTCAVDQTCKTSCATHADCVLGSYCDEEAGACLPQKADGAPCASKVECQNRICNSGSCAGPAYNDISNPIHDQACSNDTTLNAPSCPAAAPDCSTDGSCRCGPAPACPKWMVCVNLEGDCRVAGRHPCLRSADCISGECEAGLCPFTGLYAPCTDDADHGQFDPRGVECEWPLYCGSWGNRKVVPGLPTDLPVRCYKNIGF
jgi:hypothetical protein